MGQELRSSLVGLFWLKIPQEFAVRMATEALFIWRLDWGWKIYFQDGCWHEAFIFLLWESLRRSQNPHAMAVGFPQNYYFKGEQHRSHSAFYDLLSKVWHHPFLNFLLIRSEFWGVSLRVQWLRICLAMQGTQVQSVVGELRSHLPRSN